MSRHVYTPTKFGPEALARIDMANEIIEEYQAQGYVLTLRQLYYQFVARDILPNTERSYKNLVVLISKGRLSGLIDWKAIEDRTRNLESLSHWDSPHEIIEAVAEQYHRDLWEGQRVRPEVWIEKEALVGVIAGVCRELDVPYFACRGYVSQSEQWRAGRRARAHRISQGQRMIVLHLGDHDPSGVDMTRDNRDRLTLFGESRVKVKRLALNMDQIEEHDPPPNPAKVTDSRAAGYIDEYGTNSWELDALEPSMIEQLIRDAIAGLVDEERMAEAIEAQEEDRARLREIADEEELRHE